MDFLVPLLMGVGIGMLIQQWREECWRQRAKVGRVTVSVPMTEVEADKMLRILGLFADEEKGPKRPLQKTPQSRQN